MHKCTYVRIQLIALDCKFIFIVKQHSYNSCQDCFIVQLPSYRGICDLRITPYFRSRVAIRHLGRIGRTSACFRVVFLVFLQCRVAVVVNKYTCMFNTPLIIRPYRDSEMLKLSEYSRCYLIQRKKGTCKNLQKSSVTSILMLMIRTVVDPSQ